MSMYILDDKLMYTYLNTFIFGKTLIWTKYVILYIVNF